jgi:hypothetical protein
MPLSELDEKSSITDRCRDFYIRKNVQMGSHPIGLFQRTYSGLSMTQIKF